MAKFDEDDLSVSARGCRLCRVAGCRALRRGAGRVRGLTHREVGREAGVTYGLVGYHFGSRDALIHAAALKATEDAIARSDLVPSTGSLDDFAAGLAKVSSEEADAQAFQYELACEARRTPILLEHARELYRQYFDAIAQALSQFGIASDSAMARVVFAALDGIVLQQLIFDDPEATSEAVATLRKILEAVADSATLSTGSLEASPPSVRWKPQT